MIYFSPLLLSISSNLDRIPVSSSYGINKILYKKYFPILLAIISTLGTFSSMYLGNLISNIFSDGLANIFGATLFSYMGLYFLTEYFRVTNWDNGYDTSHFISTSNIYAPILKENNSSILNITKPQIIKNMLILCVGLTINNIYIGFASSFNNISTIPNLFFNFFITLLFVHIGYSHKFIHISKWFYKYSYLISGIILILLGIFEAFI